MRCYLNLLVLGMALLPLCGIAARAQTPTYTNVGRSPSQEEVRAWDIAIGPAGNELPPGKGTAKQGAPLYAQKCALCHGPTGKEGPVARLLVGGQGTLTTLHPVKTIGSYWAFATTVWDYINRAMPLKEEGSLRPDEVYAITALLLHWNGILKEDEVLDAQSLPKIQMPNRNGFVPSPWPDWKLYRDRCRAGTCP